MSITIAIENRHTWDMVRGDTHIASTLRGGGEIRQKWDVGRRKDWGISECSELPIFIFCIKENWICVMTSHHSEPNINLLMTRNLPFDSDVRQWNHLLIILLHCLWAKSNNRTRGQFEYNMTWFCFCFDFVRSHARRGCCYINCLHVQVVQIKQVDCKMSTNNVNKYE